MATADQLIDLFYEAKAKPAAERACFLDEACGSDSHLKQQVLSLLQAEADEGDSNFLNRAPLLRSAAFVTEKPGDRIGRYKLLQQLGEGGCGVVYMAEQEEPVRRRVALKVIKLGMDTKGVIARFEAERQALALMDHPNIAKVLDAGATETGRPFFVMELVQGTRITHYCDQNNLTTEQRLELFTQVCHAVQHAHQKGIIHRDLKPSNILVTLHDGMPVPKVIDFGVAKATSDQRLTDKTIFTAFAQFIGTPAYMSPEQAEMSGLDIDTRSDIYSLGVLLYELLTGRTPLDAKELLRSGVDEMRRKIREEEPPQPSTRLSTMQAADLITVAKHRQADAPKLIHLVHGDLDWIVMKCLEKGRNRRYETANGLAMDIQRHLNNEPVIAGPPSNLYRLQKLVQRNRLTFAAAGAVVAAILLTLGVLVASNVRITRESKAKLAAFNAAQASEQRAKDQLFESLQHQARARRYSRQMGQRFDSLAVVAQATQIRTDSRLRDEAIATMALPDVRRGAKWQLHRTNCVALTCDAMGERYALLDFQGVVTVRRIEDNREIHRFETERACNDCYTALVFSPDGRFLAKVGDREQPFLWSLEKGKPILQDAPMGARSPTFSTDRRLIGLSQGEHVYCFDLATGRESIRWRTADRVHTLQFHPTTNHIAVGYKDGPWVSVYDASDGREIAQLEVGKSFHTILSWHPDGRRLAVGGTVLGIQVWDVAARRRVGRLESPAHEVDLLAFHPSGNWLVSWAWDEVMRFWDPTTQRQAMQVPANLQFSRDGHWLGFFWSSEDQVELLEFVSPEEYFTLQDISGADRLAPKVSTTSPNDRLLAVAKTDGVGLWDLHVRREIARLPSGSTESVVFESDGGALRTCGTTGLQRWAIRRSSTNAFEMLIGPPHRIELPFLPVRVCADRPVQTWAVVSQDGNSAATLDLASQTTRVLPVPDPMACYIALSPDAKWLATSGWHSDHAQLWNLETRELARNWVVGRQTKIAFTPDSRELIVARGSDFNFLKVETLEANRQLRREIGLFPGDVAFSPDGKLMAMEMAPAVIHLKEVSSGRTVAQLEDPFGDRADAITFSRDGTKLMVVSTYAAAIHVWDLRAIRARLKTMGLDWDWPEFSPQNSEDLHLSRVKPRLKVQVITTEPQ